MRFGFTEALENAKWLYSLAADLRTCYPDHIDSRDRAFADFRGEYKEEALIEANALDDGHSPTVEKLIGAAEQWVQRWAEEVDIFNIHVYEEELVQMQQWLDEQWDMQYANLSVVEKPGMLILQGVDEVINIIPDDASSWVERPRAIKDDPSYWPQRPGYGPEPVFVYYRRGGDGKQALYGPSPYLGA